MKGCFIASQIDFRFYYFDQIELPVETFGQFSLLKWYCQQSKTVRVQKQCHQERLDKLAIKFLGFIEN